MFSLAATPLCTLSETVNYFSAPTPKQVLSDARSSVPGWSDTRICSLVSTSGFTSFTTSPLCLSALLFLVAAIFYSPLSLNLLSNLKILTRQQDGTKITTSLIPSLVVVVVSGSEVLSHNTRRLL